MGMGGEIKLWCVRGNKNMVEEKSIQVGLFQVGGA